MLIHVGQCEAEVKVACVMSTPRLTFSDNFFCVAAALAPHKISPIKITGAYWGQCLQRAIEGVIDTHDVILTVDYDTIFNARTVEALLVLLMHSGYDAIAPLQVKRESNAVMLAPSGVKPEDKTVIEEDWFSKAVQPVSTAHFGCTFIRTAAIKKMKKPWFIGSANEQGEFSGGHVDEDIHFWKEFERAGNKLGVSTKVSVGHAELMITWPSRESEDSKVQQHTSDYWANQKAPEKAWGVIG